MQIVDSYASYTNDFFTIKKIIIIILFLFFVKCCTYILAQRFWSIENKPNKVEMFSTIYTKHVFWLIENKPNKLENVFHIIKEKSIFRSLHTRYTTKKKKKKKNTLLMVTFLFSPYLSLHRLTIECC